MKTRLLNVQNKGPVTKAKSGKFEVSSWHWKRIIPQAKDKKDLFPEREVDVHRACIRHSQWNRNTGTWDESTIWCNTGDLRNLSEALEKLNGRQ